MIMDILKPKRKDRPAPAIQPDEEVSDGGS